jgi:hypothetical protein
MANDMGDDEPESESDEEDGGEEKPIYNPKKVQTRNPKPETRKRSSGL